MIEEILGQDVRICGAPGCDNPIGNNRSRLYCSRRCSNKVSYEKWRERRKLEIMGMVCAIEGCEHQVAEHRSCYCSKKCATIAYVEQTREGSRRNLKKKKTARSNKVKKQPIFPQKIIPRKMMHMRPEQIVANWDKILDAVGL